MRWQSFPKGSFVNMGDSHHHRREHVRRTRSGDVVPVRDAQVKNRGRATLPNSARRPDGLMDLAAPEEDVDVDHIVFAFEHPEWTSKGFTRESHRPWKEEGIPPEIAEGWHNAGYPAEEATRWRAMYDNGDVLPVTDAEKYMAEGITPADARDHHRLGETAEERIAWMLLPVRRHDISSWKNAGCETAAEVQQYLDLGFTRPQEVIFVQRFGESEAREWFSAGVDAHTATRFRSLLREGFTVTDIAAVIRMDRMDDESQMAWIRSRVPVDQIEGFSLKGYGPRAAASQIRKGETADTAPDLHRGEPVPGKAWRELKTSFEKLASAENCTMNVASERRRWDRRSVTVTITNNSDPSDTRTFKFVFSDTGRFLQGKSDVKRKTRTVSSRAAFMRLHFDR